MTRQWANCISVERVKTPRNGSKFSGALIGRTCSTLVMIHATYSPIHFDSCSWAGKMSGTKRDIRSRNGPAWLRSDCVAETGLRGQNGVAWPEWTCVARMKLRGQNKCVARMYTPEKWVGLCRVRKTSLASFVLTNQNTTLSIPLQIVHL